MVGRRRLAERCRPSRIRCGRNRVDDPANCHPSRFRADEKTSLWNVRIHRPSSGRRGGVVRVHKPQRHEFLDGGHRGDLGSDLWDSLGLQPLARRRWRSHSLTADSIESGWVSPRALEVAVSPTLRPGPVRAADAQALCRSRTSSTSCLVHREPGRAGDSGHSATGCCRSPGRASSRALDMRRQSPTKRGGTRQRCSKMPQ
jgi:hypothetical protein